MNTFKATPNCKYYLPCGLCDKTGKLCTQLPQAIDKDIELDNSINFNLDDLIKLTSREEIHSTEGTK